jgi:hypothetical protein
MRSADKREQYINLALQQCSEAYGIDNVLLRMMLHLHEAEQKQDKVQVLITQGAIKIVSSLRESLLKQAYLNLKAYFGETEWATQEASEQLNESVQSST